MYKKVQKTTTKGIFNNKNKILFVKDKKGKWELPGGRVEFGESPKTALKRECKEELSFKNVKVHNIVDAWSFCAVENSINYHFVLIIYECSATDKKIRLNHEQSNYEWIPLNKIKNLKMRKGYKDSINQYIKLKKTR